MDAGEKYYVTRDSIGLYLGVHTIAQVKASSHGYDSYVELFGPMLVNTVARYTFAGALFCIGSNMGEQLSDRVWGVRHDAPQYPKDADDRLRSSIDEATAFLRTIEKGLSSFKRYAKKTEDVTHAVYFHGDQPICSVPLCVIAEAFGNNWFFVNDEAVQIVSAENEDAMATRAQRASRLAAQKYSYIAAPGKPSTKEESGRRNKTAAQVHSQVHAVTAKNSDSPRFATRSRSGMYLGAYTLATARTLWPSAELQHSVIFVPENINAQNLVRSLSGSTAGPNAYGSHRAFRAAQAARRNMQRAGSRGIPQMLRDMKEGVVRIYGRSDTPMMTLPFKELPERFGNEWFVISTGEVQLTENALGLAVGAEAMKTPDPATQRDAVTSADVPTPPITLTVFGRDGRAIYQCGQKKSDKVRPYLAANLPKDSFDLMPGAIKLKHEVEVLGFADQHEFAQMCASVANGKSVKYNWTKREGRIDGRAPINKSPVSFDGRGKVLYIHKGTYSCIARGHRVEAVTGNLVTLTGKRALVNVNHCTKCNRYFLGYTDYLHYRKVYGPVLGNFTFDEGASSSGEGFGHLSEQSVLRLCGYNVSKTSELTSNDRHLILKNVIDRGICEKPRVMSHLDWLIRMHDSDPSYDLACEKWEDDLDWVRQYRIGSQRQFKVSGVKRSHRGRR